MSFIFSILKIDRGRGCSPLNMAKSEAAKPVCENHRQCGDDGNLRSPPFCQLNNNISNNPPHFYLECVSMYDIALETNKPTEESVVAFASRLPSMLEF